MNSEEAMKIAAEVNGDELKIAIALMNADHVAWNKGYEDAGIAARDYLLGELHG